MPTTGRWPRSASGWASSRRRTGRSSAPRGSALPERAALVQLVDVPRDVHSLAREVVVDGALEGGVGEPVEGAGGLGQEAACVLVLALRAALEERDAALDAEFQRLV